MTRPVIGHICLHTDLLLAETFHLSNNCNFEIKSLVKIDPQKNVAPWHHLRTYLHIDHNCSNLTFDLWTLDNLVSAFALETLHCPELKFRAMSPCLDLN